MNGFILLFLLVLPLYLIYYLQSNSTNSSTTKSILLTGPLGSGKTTLLTTLLFPSSLLATVTSLKSNSVILETGQKLIDIPGHVKLRTRGFVDQFQGQGEEIICVLDSNAGITGTGARDSAQYLHLLLTLLLLAAQQSKRKPSLLIYLSKSDLVTSTPTLLTRAKATISRELEKRRLASISTTGALESISAVNSSANTSFSFTSFDSLLEMKDNLIELFRSRKVGKSLDLPTDELEIFQNEILWNFEGEFNWNQLQKLIKIDWLVGNCKEGNGLAEIKQFLQL